MTATINIQSFAKMCQERGVTIEKAYYIVFGHQMSENRRRLLNRSVFPLGYSKARVPHVPYSW